MSTTAELPLLLGTVEVASATRISPSFVRIELGGDLMADLGVERPWFDQRIKLVFPGTPGVVPSFEGADDSWWDTWMARPVEERGHMRTYSIRDVVGSGAATRMVVDVVVHEGASGPGNSWALAARPGDRLATMAPRRGHPYGGIEWEPGQARRLLVVGDETALPAIAVILDQLPADARGTAFVEVPYAEDAQELDHPVGVEVVWLPRGGSPEVGSVVVPAVSAFFGEGAWAPEEEVEEDLWETPTYSGSGGEVGEDLARQDDLYAWIAGESGMVTTLRRHLVREVGLDRRQVAFMGYWRRGVSMRS